MRRDRKKKYQRTERVLPLYVSYFKGIPSFGCPHCRKLILEHEHAGLRRCYRCLNWVDTDRVTVVDMIFQFPSDFDWLSESSIMYNILPKKKICSNV